MSSEKDKVDHRQNDALKGPTVEGQQQPKYENKLEIIEDSKGGKAKPDTWQKDALKGPLDDGHEETTTDKPTEENKIEKNIQDKKFVVLRPPSKDDIIEKPKKRKKIKLIAEKSDVKINTVFKKKVTAQHQLVGNSMEIITKPRGQEGSDRSQSVRINTDGVLTSPDNAAPAPDLARTFP